MNRLDLNDDRLRSAKSRFLDGRDLPEGLLPKALERSWCRSRDFGLHPGSTPNFDELSTLASAVADEVLIEAAMPEMNQLHRSLNSPDWIVLCVDTAGRVIRTINDPRAPEELKGSLRAGRTIRERNIGANAPACVLAERKPIIVRGPEHFLLDLAQYVCVAAPIFGIDGSLAGVLDVTGLTPASPSFLGEHVALSARAIENRMIAAIADVRLLSVHVMQSFLGTAAEGILAISEQDDLIIAASEAACAMLEVKRETVVGKRLAQVLEPLPTRDPLQQGAKAVRTTTGHRVFLREHIKEPVRPRRSALPVPATPPRHDLLPASAALDPAVERAIETGGRATSKGLPLLIRGETGSGKEIAARRIHDSSRRGRPFVAVNCAALPESLMEAELFGYSDGAFTGARKGGIAGVFEEANGGTLFLDEIGDAPLTLQSKLLRVIQEGTICRLGSRREVQLNLSVISATHRDLEQMIRDGSFREDLYYRLNGLTIKLPALRERADRETLLDTLLAELSRKGSSPTLTSRARLAILSYSWPGNIRQLAQALRAAWAMSEDPSYIDVDDLPEDVPKAIASTRDVTAPFSPDLSLKETAVWLAHKTMKETDNNASEAARRLKISRTTLYKYLNKDLPLQA